MASNVVGRIVTRTITGVVWAVVVVLGLPVLAWSQCPASGPVCVEYERADVVFVGDVVSMKPEAGPTRSGVVTHVGFRVLQRFKGDVGDRITLPLGPSSEEFSYAKGQRVLVYARRRGEVWSTACMRTREVSPTDKEGQVLRALKDKQDGGVIDGSVATPQLLRSNRARDIRVVLERDGTVVGEMRSDFAGRFQTGWLAPGTYVLSVQGSSGLENRREVLVTRDSACVSVGSIASPQSRKSQRQPAP
jgi:hypothetical protein